MLKESRTPFLQRPVRRRIGFIIGRNIFKPIPVGEKLLIRPNWENEYDAQGAYRPAFGAGFGVWDGNT